MGTIIQQTPAPEGYAYINLKAILEGMHYSQKDLAQETGLSEQAISNMVNQPTMIKLESIFLICANLRIKVGDLIKINITN